MKKNWALVSIVFLFGCQSPLFDHVNAGDQPATGQVESAGDRGRVGNDVPADARGCDLEFKAAGMCASLRWVQLPTDSAQGEFVLRFWKSEAPDVLADPIDAAVFVKLWMPAMGHGSAPVTTVREAVGTFRVTQVYFVMAGDWEIRVQLKRGDSVIEQAVYAIQI